MAYVHTLTETGLQIAADAAIPTMQSAISIGNGKGAATRLKLDVYLSPEQVSQLMQMQDEPLKIVLRVESENGRQ